MCKCRLETNIKLDDLLSALKHEVTNKVIPDTKAGMAFFKRTKNKLRPEQDSNLRPIPRRGSRYPAVPSGLRIIMTNKNDVFKF